MILIALGANLPGPAGSPLDSLRAACRAMQSQGLYIADASRLYQSAPVPPSGQPDFLNAAVAVETKAPPGEVLRVLLRIEAELGRTRRQRWEARVIDLDLLDYGGQVLQLSDPPLELPHPRMAERRFVLEPVQDLAPQWRHPVTDEGIEILLAALDPAQICHVEQAEWL